MNDISYENLLIYSNAMPSYDFDNEKQDEWDDRFDMNNLDNISSDIDEEYIR